MYACIHSFILFFRTEPTDGFHPSQAGNALFAQKFFQYLEENHPETLGPVNPFNAEIDAMFPNIKKM